MAKRHSVMLASISLAALALSTAFAADVAITPAQSEPHVGPKHVAAPLTTTAATALDNSLIVMPIPPQPSPERVDAAAHETGNPINKPVAGAAIEPEVVGGEKPLSVESLQAMRPGVGLAAAGLEPGRQDVLYQAGLAYGARGGLSARAFAINEMLRRYESTLDGVYNFNDVILKRPGQPDHHAPSRCLGSGDGAGAQRRRPDRP